MEGGSLRAASHPPSQPPPQPPVPSTSVNASSPQIGWAELPPREPSTSNIVPTSPILSSLPPSPDGERPTPVPAPRYCQFLILSPMKILHIIFVCVDSPSRHYPTNQKALLGEIPFTPSALHSYFHITLYSDIVLEMQAEQETPMDGGEAKEGGRARICDFFLLKTLISLLLGDQVKRNDGSDCQYLDMGVIWLLLSIPAIQRSLLACD